jgi:hypothetical protein
MTTYKPAALRSLDNRQNAAKQFFPVVRFYSKTVSDCYWINDPQPTRGKALTIAKNTIANLKNTDK